MARSRRQIQGRVATRRITDWGFSVDTSAYVNIPAASKVLAASLTAAQVAGQAPGTIVRTRGLLSVRSDTPTGDEQQLGGFGIQFVTEVARALGVTALEGPVADSLSDRWFVHQYFAQSNVTETAVGVNPFTADNYVIDSKAMRKFDGSEGLAMLFENNHATFGFDVALFLRILIKAS